MYSCSANTDVSNTPNARGPRQTYHKLQADQQIGSCPARAKNDVERNTYISLISERNLHNQKPHNKAFFFCLFAVARQLEKSCRFAVSHLPSCCFCVGLLRFLAEQVLSKIREWLQNSSCLLQTCSSSSGWPASALVQLVNTEKK